MSSSGGTSSSTMASSASSSITDSSGRSSRRLSGMSPEKAHQEPCRLGSRRRQYCTQWHLPHELMCGGCRLYLQSTEGKPTSAMKSRDVTHTSERFECKQPWKMVPSDVTTSAEKNYKYSASESRGLSVVEWIKKNENCNLARLAETPRSAIHSVTKRAISTGLDTTSTISTTSETFLVVEDDASTNRKKKKAKEDIGVETLTINSQGHSFEITGVPKTHVLIHRNWLEHLRNIEDKLKAMEGSLGGERFNGNCGQLTKTLIAVALSSAPSLPLYQAAHIMPLFVGAFLLNYGLINKAKVDNFAKCFPSETYLRDLFFDFAAENLFKLGEKVKGKHVFLSCDKGNKKGVGHFVKVLSWYHNGRVVKQCLDIDGSEGNTEQCADAIAASLKKIGLQKLQGQSTDSGGGGVLHGLATALEARQLCSANYLVASCSLHNLQLTISKPVKDTMGDVGLDKKNLMQLLHSVYDLQDSMTHDVWKLIVQDSETFLLAHGGVNEYNPVTPADIMFASKWNKVKTFRYFGTTITDRTGKKVKCKFQAPVLTRWWTVGEASESVYECFLLLVKICQSVFYSSTRSE